MWSIPQETADMVTFTEETLHEKLQFLCIVNQGDGLVAFFTKES